MSVETIAPMTFNPLPAEGEGGVFSESWFPVCLSTDVRPGQVIGRSFLDGRIIIFRGEDGVANVLSSYCPHVGADLSCGDVIGNQIRCAFHHWEFNGAGRCTHTAVGDAAPPSARLFRFPVRERWGIIFAFNGPEATWELPSFEYPDEQLLVNVQLFPEIACDPWVVCCNTPDVQHIKVLHKIQLADDLEPATYTDHSMTYRLRGTHPAGAAIDWRVGIYGTSLFFQEGDFSGVWIGVTTPLGMPRPGRTLVFAVLAVRLEDSSPEARERASLTLAAIQKIENAILFEDAPVLQRIRFRPGALTKNDRELARFFDYLRGYPRSHHSASFIK